MTESARPVIFEFQRIADYVAAMLDWRRSVSPSISLRGAAKREGLSHTPEPVLLRSSRIDGFNPTCERDNVARERPMEIEAEGVTFTCVYKGMSASTRFRGETSFLERGTTTGCGE